MIEHEYANKVLVSLSKWDELRVGFALLYFLFVIFFFYRRKKLILNYELFAWRTYLLIHEILNTLQHQIPDWNSCSWHSREAKGEEKQQVRLLQTINQMKHMKIQINESTVSTLRHRFTWEGNLEQKQTATFLIASKLSSQLKPAMLKINLCTKLSRRQNKYPAVIIHLVNRFIRGIIFTCFIKCYFQIPSRKINLQVLNVE